MPAAQFMAVFGPYAARVEQILDRRDAAEVAAATAMIQDSDDEIPLRPAHSLIAASEAAPASTAHTATARTEQGVPQSPAIPRIQQRRQVPQQVGALLGHDLGTGYPIRSQPSDRRRYQRRHGLPPRSLDFDTQMIKEAVPVSSPPR